MSSGVGRRAFWLLALALLGFLSAAWFTSGAPVPLKAGVAGLLVVAAVRPGLGADDLGEFGSAHHLDCQLHIATRPRSAAARSHDHRCHYWRSAALHVGRSTRLALPALWLGIVAIASGLSELPARLMATAQDS